MNIYEQAVAAIQAQAGIAQGLQNSQNNSWYAYQQAREEQQKHLDEQQSHRKQQTLLLTEEL